MAPTHKVQVVEPSDESSRVIAPRGEILSQEEILRRVSKQLPYNRQGAPKGYYRTDLIPPEVAREDLSDILEAAYVDLHTDEGFPAFPDGRPFWNRMDCESPFAFHVFKIYLDMGDTGPRSMESLLESTEVLHHVKQAIAISSGNGFGPLNSANVVTGGYSTHEDDLSGFEDGEDSAESRDTSGTSAPHNSESVGSAVPRPGGHVEYPLSNFARPTIDVTSPDGIAAVRRQLQVWFHSYYWRERTRTHDIYRAAAHKHIKSRRAMTAETLHFDMSQTVIEKLKKYMDSDEFTQLLDPKLAIDSFIKLATLQRTSLGLDKTTPNGKGAITEETQDFEMVLRQVAQKNNTEGTHTVDEDGRLLPTHDTLLKDVLGDGDATHALQELIIRSTVTRKTEVNNESDTRMDENDLRDDLGL